MLELLKEVIGLLGNFGITTELLTTVSAVVSAILLIKKQYEEYNLKKEVSFKIVLKGTNESTIGAFKITRKEVSRGEILGLMGMLAGGKRVDITYLKSPKLLQNIKDVKKGVTPYIIIECSEEEYQNFL